MIKVSVLYPNKPGAKFDTSYYFAKHMPLVARKLGAAVKTTSVDQGLGGPAPGSPPAFVMMAHFTFGSVGDFQAVFGPHAAEIMGDIPNYTSIEPIIQISEVKA
jgi:uncharacterized protein (TIGR02118 family)